MTNSNKQIRNSTAEFLIFAAQNETDAIKIGCMEILNQLTAGVV